MVFKLASRAAQEVFENERFMPLRGWGARGNLLPGERGRFSSRSGGRSWPEFPDVRLPGGWQWEGAPQGAGVQGSHITVCSSDVPRHKGV